MPSPLTPDNVFHIGRMGKPHGVHGELTMQVDDDVFDRVDSDCLILSIDGLLVPFFIEEYRFRSDTMALMKLEDVDSVEQARELTNAEVFFPRHLAGDSEDGYSWDYFVGFHIVDADSKATVGRIASIDDSTVNVLFCLDDNRLIPAAEEWITDIDHDHHTITMRLPQGLLNL